MVPVTFICIFSWKSKVATFLSRSERDGLSILEILTPKISSAEPCGITLMVLLPKTLSIPSIPNWSFGKIDER